MVYTNGFDRSAMGLAAATAIILFAIIFTFTLLQRAVVGERANV
jgi:ABC-type sugar transport system permease subunit